MSKIGFILPLYQKSKKYGGATKFSILLAKKLQKEGHEVEILVPWAEDFRTVYNPFFNEPSPEIETLEELKIKKFRLKWYKNIPNFLFRIIFRYKKTYFKNNFFNKFVTFIGPHFIGIEEYIIKQNFDVIHLSCFPYYYMVEIPRNLKNRKFRGKIIATPFFHAEKRDWSNPIFQECFKLVDKIHCVTNFEEKVLRNNFKINKNKLSTIPLFLESEEYHARESIENNIRKFKEKYKLRNKIIILCIYSDMPNTKGFQETKKVFENIKTQNKVLLVIGKDDFSKYSFQKNIINLGRPIGHDKNIVFASCDIFCMPSATESFGLVYLEAWNYKKPVIALDTPQMREILSEGALFSKPNDLTSLKKNLNKLISNQNLRIKLGNIGYKKLQDNFLLSKVFKDYIKLFNL